MKFDYVFRQLNRMDMFSPYFFFPFIVLLYFGTSLADFGRFDYFQLRHSIWPVVLIGLLSYWLTVWVVRSKNWRFSFRKMPSLNGKSLLFLYILGGIGLVAYIIMIADGQIGITAESARRSIDSRLYFLSSLLWFAMLFISSWFLLIKNQKPVIYSIVMLLTAGLFLVTGYRTPVIVILFTALVLIHYTVKNIRFTWFLVALLLVGLLFSMFGFYRFISEDPSDPYNSRELPEVSDELNVAEIEERNQILRARYEQTPAFIRAINNESVTGHVVLSKIIEHTEENGYLYGDIQAGIWRTVLPGEQPSPRMLITELANNQTIDEGIYITRPGRTTTPTLFGQFFADFGYAGVILGSMIAGFLITILYNQSRQEGARTYQTIAYSFSLTILTISLHTGLLDLIFILMIGFALLSSTLEKKIRHY